VTIVVRDRLCTFGDVRKDTVLLNDAGEMVQRQWRELGVRFEGVDVETFVVMPNHLHGLVSMCFIPNPPTLGRLVGAFKSMTTRDYAAGADRGWWRPMRHGLWQRGYYDHVVRDEADEARVVEYIHANPINWSTDRENPDNPAGVGDDESRLFSRAPVGKPFRRGGG